MLDDKIQYLVLGRRDPDANMARFYVLPIEVSLFGDAALNREWGRIGTAGQRKIELHASNGGPPRPLRFGCSASCAAAIQSGTAPLELIPQHKGLRLALE
jgi:predicted DNA-binding WGR domain protein